jgi:CubicO group peptidase (beta-lactamase class C family)
MPRLPVPSSARLAAEARMAQDAKSMPDERIAELFHANFTDHGELGAAVSVWRAGREVVSLAGGWKDRAMTDPWTEETMVLFWSATKGLAASCLLHACQENGVDPTTTVAEVWPEFAQAGKERVTIAEALSHQAGLAALPAPTEVMDHDAVAAALAASAPNWPLGEGHGYHPRTFGFLVEEILRRITRGRALGEYWRTEFGEPLALEVWIGLPAERVKEPAAIFPAKNSPPKGDPFYTAFLTPSSITARSFASPRGLHSVAAMNAPEARAASFGAFGGIGSARGLAKFYAMLANGGELGGRRFFAAPTLVWMTTTLTQGPDRVLLLETAFSAGFMRDPLDAEGRKKRTNFGKSVKAFGHPGAGGSHAFADPENNVSFAYLMNQMEPGVLPGPKSLRLVDEL